MSFLEPCLSAANAPVRRRSPAAAPGRRALMALIGINTKPYGFAFGVRDSNFRGPIALRASELQSLQIVSADSVYDPGSNAVHSTTTRGFSFGFVKPI